MVPSFQSLPDILDALSTEAPPAVPRAPGLVLLNEGLATDLGLDPGWLASEQGTAWLAGGPLDGSPIPRAFAYAGHQFGGFVPLLGDGRAALLGELRDAGGRAWQVQLKGAGRTPYSRPGSDGRAWLGPVLREYVISEAMHALGIPTTRALAVASTGSSVLRERPWPGAVLTRVSRGLVRVGTVEFLSYRGDLESMTQLVQHCLDRHFPDAEAGPSPASTLLAHVGQRQASLVAQWLAVGFIHGVMNTDNCSIPGETLDYGPCAFLDTYHPETAFSSIDHYGRYAYANQPRIAHWNLAALAQALLPILDREHAQEVLDQFPNWFAAAHESQMRRKLGLGTEAPDDGALAADLLSVMDRSDADFTRTFRALSHLGVQPGPADEDLRAEFADGRALDSWVQRWRARVSQEECSDTTRQQEMLKVNPAVIPRNHQIEHLIQAAVLGDHAPLMRLMRALSTPFVLQPQDHDLSQPPASGERVYQTFCGT